MQQTKTTTNESPIVPDRLGVVARFIIYRLLNNRDVKIVVTARGSQTGTGKSTLAVLIAKWIHSLLHCRNCGYITPQGYPRCKRCENPSWMTKEPWTADDLAFMDVGQYKHYYTKESTFADTMILDEAELLAHNRRAMSGDNVEMTKIFAALRYRNCVSILTLPTTNMIDSQIEELSDIWINVQRRGVAEPYWFWSNDFGGVHRVPVYNEYGMRERIYFDDLSGDPAYESLNDMKEDYFEGGGGNVYDEEELEERLTNATESTKKDITKWLVHNTDLNQTEIGNIPAIDKSQGWVSKVANGQA